MKKLFKWFGIAVGGLFVLMVVAAFVGDPKAKDAGAGARGSAAAPSKAAAEPPAPPIQISAAALHRDYDDNEVAADQKYKGKRLAVSGTVQSIDKDAFDNIVIKLRTANQFMAVHASFDDKHEEMAAGLKKGAKVSWVYDGAGLILGSPMLRKCVPA